MYKVELENRGEMFFIAKSKDYLFNIDLKGKGMNPPDVFLASLAGCIGVYFRKYLESAKLEISGFKITAEGEFTQEAPYRFSKIKISIDIKETHLEEKRKSAIMEFIKNCPLHNTLKYPPEINLEIF
ncbi:MAG: OsmC family protein [Candidatus Omnitrophica bacterium]|nr:OsmC family protein [Candidatus Omnitrophota bacterium]MCM8793448.1 OsmC family protein [Candidatus Omnitrophota bacterium]